MKDRLTEALKKSTADYCEIRFETEDWTSIAYRGPEIETVGSGKFEGGIVRACTNGGWGMSVFDSLDSMEHHVQEACICAKLVGCETTQLAEIENPPDKELRAQLDHDFRGVSLDEKLNLIARYNTIILKSHPSIETSQVRYNDTFRTVFFVSSKGAYFCEERPIVRLVYFAVARDGALVQLSFDTIASAKSYDVVHGQEENIKKVAQRAVDLLKAPPCPGGKFTVILDQKLGGVFAHEAFGHLSEADFLYENPKMRDLMSIGKRMGNKDLNIVDDGSRGQLIGTHSYDDEGTPTGKTYLIKEGILNGHLHSLETAAKMGEKPTGNARAISRGVPPIVRMTNTYIENGEHSFEELIQGVDEGIYACGALGGQTMMEMFTFSAEYGYRIRKGEIGEMVRDVILTGNVFETLYNIDGFGKEFKIIESAGGCGKGGQSPLPVTDGAPHLRIRDVVIGGK
ncbi:MAG: TldD/PmbA family protein [bacterium]